MPIVAAPILVKQRFRFVVEVASGGSGGFVRARFRTCSELSAEIAKSEIHHGGSVIPFKMPGRVTFSDVTLEYGATSDGALFAWFAQTAIAGGAIGGSGFAFKRPVSIVEQDRDGSTENRWHLAGSFPTKFVAGEWDNESDDFTISSVTLTYDFFAPTLLNGSPLVREMGALAARL